MVAERRFSSLTLELDGGVATVTLNRPDVHNAFNPELIAELREVFEACGRDDRVRVVVLTGAGISFCAGADLRWMQESVRFTEEQNRADALAIARMLESIAACPQPVPSSAACWPAGPPPSARPRRRSWARPGPAELSARCARH